MRGLVTQIAVIKERANGGQRRFRKVRHTTKTVFTMSKILKLPKHTDNFVAEILRMFYKEEEEEEGPFTHYLTKVSKRIIAITEEPMAIWEY